MGRRFGFDCRAGVLDSQAYTRADADFCGVVECAVQVGRALCWQLQHFFFGRCPCMHVYVRNFRFSAGTCTYHMSCACGLGSAHRRCVRAKGVRRCKVYMAVAAAELGSAMGGQVDSADTIEVVLPPAGHLAAAWEKDAFIRQQMRDGKKLLAWTSRVTIGAANQASLVLNRTAIMILIDVWGDVCREPKSLPIRWVRDEACGLILHLFVTAIFIPRFAVLNVD